MVYRIIQAVGEHIIAEYTLTCACELVRIKESAGVGVVITGLQVIQLGFGIVDIASVAEGIDIGEVGCRGDRRAGAVGDGGDFSPRIIGIADNDRTGSVGHAHDIPLQVQEIVVDRLRRSAIAGIERRIGFSIRPVEKFRDLLPLSHARQLRAAVEVFRGRPANGFGAAKAAGIIGERAAFPIAAYGRKLTAVLPGHRIAAVGRGIADLIVGDGCAVIGSQQIRPVAVSVGIGRCCAVFRGAQNVARAVIGVGGYGCSRRVPDRCQLAEGIIAVGIGAIAGDAPHAVIGIVQIQQRVSVPGDRQVGDQRGGCSRGAAWCGIAVGYRSAVSRDLRDPSETIVGIGLACAVAQIDRGKQTTVIVAVGLGADGNPAAAAYIRGGPVGGIVAVALIQAFFVRGIDQPAKGIGRPPKRSPSFMYLCFGSIFI